MSVKIKDYEIDEDMDVENVIEDKYRNVKMENKLIAYVVRKDASTCASMIPELFTINYYQKFFEIISKKFKTFEIESFKRIVYKNIEDEDEKEEVDIFINKIFTTKLKSFNSDKAINIVYDLRELYEAREFMLSINDVVEESTNVNFDINTAKDRVRESLLIDSGANKRKSGEYLEDWDERYENIIERQENLNYEDGLKFGIPKLDDVTGGIMKGEVSVTIAPPGTGKSIFLQNSALNFWMQKTSGVFVSLEMSKRDIQYRMDSRMGRIGFSKFRKADLSEIEMKRYKKAFERLKEANGDNFLEIVCPGDGCTMRMIEEECLRAQDKRKKKIEWVVVDYLTLLSPNNNRSANKDDYRVPKAVSWEMKNFAANFNNEGIPVVSAGQVTDDFNHSAPSQMNAKYARAISENAQMMFALAQTPEDFLEGILKLWFLKMRNAPKIEPISMFPSFDLMTTDRQMMDMEKQLIGYKK